jgi:hypothetical protein
VLVATSIDYSLSMTDEICVAIQGRSDAPAEYTTVQSITRLQYSWNSVVWELTYTA